MEPLRARPDSRGRGRVKNPSGEKRKTSAKRAIRPAEDTHTHLSRLGRRQLETRKSIGAEVGKGSGGAVGAGWVGGWGVGWGSGGWGGCWRAGAAVPQMPSPE